MYNLLEQSRNNPIKAGLLILFFSLLFRINDIFILKIDELWGEIILSKSLGFVLILLFLFLAKKKINSIGIHEKDIKISLMIGVITTIAIYIISYGMEYFFASISDKNPTFQIYAIDPKQGVAGGLIFALWLVLGNIINAFMEEGLFRGLLIPQLLTKHSFWVANTIQAFFFGLWHLVWPIKDVLMGKTSVTGAIIMGSLLFLGTMISGFVWGYMFYKTNSLWTPLIAHFLANTILNLVHINSLSGLDSMIMIRSIAASNLGLISMIIIRHISRKYKLKNLEAWDN